LVDYSGDLISSFLDIKVGLGAVLNYIFYNFSKISMSESGYLISSFLGIKVCSGAVLTF